MKKCTNCGAEFEGKFCPECGTKWQDKRVCPQCGNELTATARFCPECGCSVSDAAKESKAETAACATAAPSVNETVQTNARPAAAQNKASAADIMGTAHKVLKYIPAGLFALFSLLLFAFYAGSIAVAEGFGESLGSVYGDITDNIPGMGGCVAALVIFLLASLALTAFMALGLFHGKFKGKAVGLFGKAYLLLNELLNYIAFALYFIFFVISIVVMAKVSSFDGGMGLISSGACPKLILAFSIIFAVFSGAALVCDMLIGKKFPQIVESDKNARTLAIEECKAAEEKKRAQKEEAAAKEAERAKEESAKADTEAQAAYDDTPVCLDGKPVLKKVNTYVRFRRMLKGMAIANMTVSYALIMCMSMMFGAGLTKDIIFYIGLGVFCLFALIGIVCVLPPVKHWAPAHLIKRSAVSGGNAGADRFFIAGLVANVICVVAVALISNLAIEEDEFKLVVVPLAVLMSIFAVFNLMGIIASSAVKSRYKELANHFYGTNKPYADMRPKVIYNPEKEAAFYASYKKNKTVTSGYANSAVRTNVCAVRGVVSFIFAAIAVACLIAFQFVLSPFSASYVSLLSHNQCIYEYELRTFLGEPDEFEDKTAVYYGGEFKSAYNEMKELTEDFEEATFNGDANKMASILAKAEALEKKMETMVFDSLIIKFDDNSRITSIRLDTCTRGNGEFTKKTVEKVELEKGTQILRGYAGICNVYVKYFYTDGSYKYEPLPSSVFAQLDPTKTAPQVVEWEDGWGEYFINIRTADSVSGEYKGVKYTVARNEKTNRLAMKLSGKLKQSVYGSDNYPWKQFVPYVNELTYAVQSDNEYSGYSIPFEGYTALGSVIISRSVDRFDMYALKNIKSITNVWVESASIPSNWNNYSPGGEWEQAVVHLGGEWGYVDGVPTLKNVYIPSEPDNEAA